MKERIAFVDYIRVLACLMVMVVHNPLLPVWLAIPTIGLLSFICCAITTKLLSLLPGSKYIVGC